MASGAAVYGDQIEPVFDVVMGFCSRELLGGNGFQREVSTIPQQRIQAGPSLGGVHSKGPIVRLCSGEVFGLQVGAQRLQVPLHRRWTTPLIRCPEEPTRHGSEWAG